MNTYLFGAGRDFLFYSLKTCLGPLPCCSCFVLKDRACLSGECLQNACSCCSVAGRLLQSWAPRGFFPKPSQSFASSIPLPWPPGESEIFCLRDRFPSSISQGAPTASLQAPLAALVPSTRIPSLTTLPSTYAQPWTDQSLGRWILGVCWSLECK